MSGRIPQGFIDDLLARVDLVELIGQRIPLKRAGKEYQARCPFHDERSPSFTVSPSKQFYHCFGCGAHGTALGFLMQYDGLEFVDAVETLAGQLGLTVPAAAGAREEGLDQLYSILAEANSWFRQQLTASTEARAYLQRRELAPEIVEAYGLGYAPDGWDGLTRRLGSSAQRLRLLADAGLTSQGSRGVYDKFRARLMFPIHDRRHRPIAFGGRVLQADQQPKYLNSPETRLFHKGEVLYGLPQARRQGNLPRIIVVEGYMDVLALAQQGFAESVATLGTATSRSHAELLFRQAPEVVFCFDGDRAGREAAWRALEAVLPRLTEGRQAQFLFLPEGEDPDSLVRRDGQAAFAERLAAALPLSDYLFDTLGKDLRLDSIDGRARLADRARPLVQQIPDSAFRDLMVEELARRTGVRRTPAPTAPSTETTARPFRADGRSQAARRVQRTPVRGLISLLLTRPSLVQEIPQPVPFAQLDVPGVPLLLRLIERLREGVQVAAAVIEAWPDPAEARILLKLAQDSPVDEDDDDAVLRGELSAYQARLLEQSEQLVSQRLATADSPQQLSEADKQALRESLARRNALYRDRH
ncbi:MAG: DNA primase [Xanthomonadales bacterium]|nr:DNA primase [Xanthomonadales bacterium]